MINTNEIKRKNLKRLLDSSGMKPADLAKKIGTTGQYINSLLNAEKGLSDKSIPKFAIAFNVDEYEFYIGVIPTNRTQENIKDNNILQFPVLIKNESPRDPETIMLHEFLDEILNYGDKDLILAIKMNLISFKKTTDALKGIAEQGEQLKDALDRIRILEAKGG